MPYYRNRRGAPKPARWMDLRYTGQCQVCRRELAARTRAFYDPSDCTVTCTDLACAKAAGLTKQEWHGSPVSGSWVDVLSERRIGSTVSDPFAKTRSRGYFGRDAGRCEDAPCCGCCP